MGRYGRRDREVGLLQFVVAVGRFDLRERGICLFQQFAAAVERGDHVFETRRIRVGDDRIDFGGVVGDTLLDSGLIVPVFDFVERRNSERRIPYGEKRIGVGLFLFTARAG